jgi:SAM-dependent methyltransferase
MINITPTGAWNYNESAYNENRYFDKGVADGIIDLLGNSFTILDFGCGSGCYLKYFKENVKDIDVLGVEPLVDQHEGLLIQDIVNKDLTQNFDLGKRGHLICLEVLEHIPASLQDFAIDNIIRHCNGYLIISWAKIDQPGIGHINCKAQTDVINLFQERGYIFLEEVSLKIRNAAKLPWLRDNLCVFK